MKTTLLVLSCLLVASTADAQRLTDARGGAANSALPTGGLAAEAESARRVGDAGAARNAAMAGMGTLFAAGGLFAGAYVGAAAACGNSSHNDYCGLGGGLVGALVGEMIMLPMGVHYVSSQSSYGRKLLASSAVMLGGMALAPLTAGISLLAVPPVQLLAAMHVERRAIAARAGR